MKFNSKQEQWQWIKSEWPELAKFLIGLNEKMGKPERVEIKEK